MLPPKHPTFDFLHNLPWLWLPLPPPPSEALGHHPAVACCVPSEVRLLHCSAECPEIPQQKRHCPRCDTLLALCPMSVVTRYYSSSYTELESRNLWREKCFPLVRAVGAYSYFGNHPLRQGRPSNFFQLKNLFEISNKSNPLFSGKTSLDNHVKCGSSKENQDVHHRWLQPRWR